jgi:hypothetical protein
MLQIGLALSPESLGITHLALAGTLVGLVLLRPRTWVRRLLVVLGIAFTLLLPFLWVGPIWSAGPEWLTFLLGFYQKLALSLAIPFGIGAVVMSRLAHRAPLPRKLVAGAVITATYVLGLMVSYPVSFNYALLYPLLR